MLDAVYTTKNYRLVKIRSSFSRGFIFLETIKYPQYIGEISLMTGRIAQLGRWFFIHFYFGLGGVAGRKQDRLIYSIKPGEGGGLLGGPIFGSTEYKMQEFVSVGFAFDLMIMLNRVGYGVYEISILNCQMSA